uniref:Uncharacterized protein n=1 Tax=Sphaerodactylus townsendi TaxID=933632 RepID=A0ACB8F7T0_9SAUR
MADMNGATGRPLTGEPDEGTGQVPGKDEIPRDPDLGDEEKDALVPDQHDPHLGVARSTNREASMGLPYSWAPSRQPCWGAAVAGWREFTWLTQPMGQDIYSEWDPVAQSEWSRVQVQAGAWAPEQGMVAWRQEQDEMQQEIHFIWRKMELLLASTKAAERDHQDPPQLPPPPPPEGGQLMPMPPTTSSKDPFEEEKARARLRQIRQGSRSMSEYVSVFRQLAGVVQDWPEQVKIHFFQEGLHPEVAQWAMVTAEPTSLAGWYTRAGEAEVRLCRVQLLKQRGNPPPASPRPPLGGTSPARGGKKAGESLYAQQRRLGLCLSCGGEGHKAAMCPSKKSDPLVVPAGSATKAGMAKGPGKMSPFKKGSGLQVELREVSSASEEAGGPESSEGSAGNDSDLA